jgi:hypothetical protein
LAVEDSTADTGLLDVDFMAAEGSIAVVITAGAGIAAGISSCMARCHSSATRPIRAVMDTAADGYGVAIGSPAAAIGIGVGPVAVTDTEPSQMKSALV